MKPIELCYSKIENKSSLNIKKLIQSEGFRRFVKKNTNEAIAFYRDKERIWEKNIPLWLAEYFIHEGYKSVKMGGNFATSHESVSHYSKSKKIKTLLTHAGKSKLTNHSDFCIFDKSIKNPILIVEIKSQLNNKKLTIKDLIKDLNVVRAHQAHVGKKGFAVLLYINKTADGTTIERNELESAFLEKNEFKNSLLFLKQHLIIVF